LTTVRTLGGIFAAACLLTCVTACSGGSTTAAPAITSAPPSSTSVSKPKTTAPTFTPAASPASLSAACPFLSSDEILKLTGQSMSGGSKDLGQTKTKVGTAYECQYGAGVLGELFVGTDSTSPARFISGSKTGCAAPVTVPGVGDAAMHCKSTGPDGGTVLAVAKQSHGQLRTAQLFLYAEGTDESYAAIMKLLGDRL
jgi:hypothetical protein